jgi:hypothetical protein
VTQRTSRQVHRRASGRRMALLMAVVVTTLLLAPAVAGTSGTPAASQMDFRASTFRLVDLAPEHLPFQTAIDPTIPPDWHPSDAEGIQMRQIGGKLYYHPLLLCDKAFRLLNAYTRTGDPAYLDWARRYAAKMRELAVTSDGALFMPYSFDFPQTGVRAPWFSGMAQGMTLTVFVRMYRATGEQQYLTAANQLFRSFQRSGPAGRPWVSRVSDTHELWIEEYPQRQPDRVLNGFMFAIYGLYEYWQLTRWDPARHYLEGALTTLKAHILDYRVPGGISYYSLRARAQYEHYHFVHIKMLRQIYGMTRDEAFRKAAGLFKKDHWHS